ncbi:MAG: hypothetical protein WC959_10800 [Kiritimatiellales bacterium]
MKSFYYLLTIAFLYQCQPLPAQTLGVESLPGKPGAIPVYVNPGLLGDSGIMAEDIPTLEQFNSLSNAVKGKVDNSGGTATNLTVAGTFKTAEVTSENDLVLTSSMISGTYQSRIYLSPLDSVRPLYFYEDASGDDWVSLYTELALLEDVGEVSGEIDAVIGEIGLCKQVTSPRLEVVSNRLITVEQEVEWTTNKVWEFGAATNWIHPSRLEYGKSYALLNKSLEESTWSNAIFLFDAALPAYKAGQTTARWLDWSPEKMDMVQPTVARQPALTNTASGVAYYFDGADDRLYTQGNINIGTNDFLIEVEMEFLETITTNNMYVNFYGYGTGIGSATNGYIVALHTYSSDNLRAIVGNTALSPVSYMSENIGKVGSLVGTGFRRVWFKKIGTVLTAGIDGDIKATATAPEELPVMQNVPFYFGNPATPQPPAFNVRKAKIIVGDVQ